MRIIVAFVAMVVLASSVFAFTDIGVLNKPKTLGYYLLSATERSMLSSGLVYTQKQNDKLSLEISYTGYQSFYLLTKNVTKIRVDGKYKLVEWGILGLYGMGGAAMLYSPSVGPGLALDAGGVAALNIMEGLGVAIPLNFLFFNDGTEMNFAPTINYKPPFWEYEIYGGMRGEAQIIGGFGSAGSSGGKLSLYLEFGLRAGL